MAQFTKLPTPTPAPRDDAAYLDLALAIEKWNQLQKPNIIPSPEGKRFLKAVELGFVENSASGYQTFIGWLVATKEDILSSHLFAWYGFLLRYIAYRNIDTLPTAIRTIALQYNVNTSIIQTEFAAIYEVDSELLDGLFIDIGSGYVVPKMWILEHTVDENGRQRVTYRINGGEATTTVSFGGSLPALPPFETHLEIVFTTDAPSPGDGVTFATLAWREVNKRWISGVGSEIESVSPWQRWVDAFICRDALQIGSTFAIEDIRRSTTRVTDPDGRQGQVWDINGLERALTSSESTPPPKSWGTVSRKNPFVDASVEDSIKALLDGASEEELVTATTDAIIVDANKDSVGGLTDFGRPLSDPISELPPSIILPPIESKSKKTLLVVGGILVVLAVIAAVILL